MTRPTIMLTSCGGTAAQNVLWALRHTGDPFRVIGVDADKYRIYSTEGFDRKYLVPHSRDASYVTVLNDIIEAEAVEFLHAQADAEVGVISSRREELRTRLMLPANEVVQICHDKFATKERLREAGIATARGFLIESDTDLVRAIDELGSPVWVRAIRGAGGRGSLPVKKLEHARMWIDYWNGWGSFVAEEYLPGRTTGWIGVYHHRQLVCSIARDWIATLMSEVAPSGITGNASVIRLVNDKDVHRISRQTVEAIDPSPTGVYFVEITLDVDGVYCVTEVNPGRFSSGCFMYAKAGYNIVQMFFDLALGRAKAGDFDVKARFPEDLYWIRGIDVLPVMRNLEFLPEIGQLCE